MEVNCDNEYCSNMSVRVSSMEAPDKDSDADCFTDGKNPHCANVYELSRDLRLVWKDPSSPLYRSKEKQQKVHNQVNTLSNEDADEG